MCREIVAQKGIIQTLPILCIRTLAGLSLPEDMTSRRQERPGRCLLVTASLQYKGA